MKNYLVGVVLVLLCLTSLAQNKTKKYPEPEFTNEVTLLKNDSSLMRLEKGVSNLDTKMKMAGFGGAESGYSMDGEKSTVRIADGNNLSFIFFTGAASSSSINDSLMKSYGVNQASYSEMTASANDPARRISLYKVEVEKGNRKIFLQKSGGTFGNKKNQSSEKYTFSVKKIRDGYWELIIDKPLPKGEYAFSMMDMTGASGAMGAMLFAFGVD
jgi:hypothetical protein